MEPVHVFAKWQVKEGQVSAVLPLLSEVAQKSQAEPGNLFYRIHQSQTEPNTLVLFEGYTNEAAVAAHLESEHFQKIVIGQIVPLLEAREVIVTSPLDLGAGA